MSTFKKALKEQARLRLALCGLAGSGKTMSALAIADAISKMMRARSHGHGKVAVIDSERGSASLYADRFDFDVCELDSFSPLAYVERIKEAESAGYDIINKIMPVKNIPFHRDKQFTFFNNTRINADSVHACLRRPLHHCSLCCFYNFANGKHNLIFP